MGPLTFNEGALSAWELAYKVVHMDDDTKQKLFNTTSDVEIFDNYDCVEVRHIVSDFEHPMPIGVHIMVFSPSPREKMTEDDILHNENSFGIELWGSNGKSKYDLSDVLELQERYPEYLVTRPSSAGFVYGLLLSHDFERFNREDFTIDDKHIIGVTEEHILSAVEEYIINEECLNWIKDTINKYFDTGYLCEISWS